MATLSDVPDGVLAHVFALLAAPNRPAVRLVCKHWCQLARSSHAFWANLKIVLCSTTSPSALGVLYRLLAKQKNILIQLEVAAAGAGESLRFALSNTVGGSLRHLRITANTQTRAQLEVVGNLQSLVTLKVTYAFELPGSFTDRVEAMDLQHFSRLSALRWLTIDIHDNKPEGEMLEEELINLFIEPEAGLPLQLPSLPSLTSLHVMNKAGGQRLMLSNHMLHGLCRLRHLHMWGARLDFSSEDLPGAWQKLEGLLLIDTHMEDAAIATLPLLPHLTKIYVSGGMLYHRPATLDSIAACPALKHLSLYSFEASRLPILAPSQLASLSTLSLDAGTASEHLPSSWCLPSLQELTLTLCRRLASSPEAWPPEMSRMTRLHTLRLELLQLPQLPAPVCRLSSLTCLGLEGNQLQTLPEGPYLSNLLRLSLSWNRLPRIPLALALASRLEELDLASNNGPSLWPAGLQVLQGLKQLRRVNLVGWVPGLGMGAVPLPGLPWEVVAAAHAVALPHVQIELTRCWVSWS